MKRPSPFSELPPQCLEWEHCLIGGDALDRIRDERPDTWVAVYDLRPLELIAGLLFPNRWTARPPMAVMYCSEEGKFIAYPLWLMPESVRPGILRPWFDLWLWLLFGLFHSPSWLVDGVHRQARRVVRFARRQSVKAGVHAELRYLEFKTVLRAEGS